MQAEDPETLLWRLITQTEGDKLVYSKWSGKCCCFFSSNIGVKGICQYRLVTFIEE